MFDLYIYKYTQVPFVILFINNHRSFLRNMWLTISFRRIIRLPWLNNAINSHDPPNWCIDLCMSDCKLNSWYIKISVSPTGKCAYISDKNILICEPVTSSVRYMSKNVENTYSQRSGEVIGDDFLSILRIPPLKVAKFRDHKGILYYLRKCFADISCE